MVHIFLPEMREFYALESLWEDAEIKEIPNQD
ncbi:RsfS/YbeB/iojap family protein [Alloprevotella tannerae]